MIAKYLKHLSDAWGTGWDYLMALFYARTVPDWHFFFWVCLIAAIIMGSAFLSATIAENRNHKMKLHFLLGLLVPYIYPFILGLRLKMAQAAIDEEEIDPLSGLSLNITGKFKDIQKAKEEANRKRRTRLKPKTEEEEAEANSTADEDNEDESVEEIPAEPEPADAVQQEPIIFTQRHFQDIAVDDTGARIGPFRLLTKNGLEFKVCQIKNIQKDMASFEVEVKGSTKNIRIKYDNIEVFDKIN